VVVKNTFASFTILIALVLGGFACKDNPPQPPSGIISWNFTIEDIGVKEIWLRLKYPSSPLYQSLSITRNDRSDTIFHLQVNESNFLLPDTIIRDDLSLLPKHQYVYTALAEKNLGRQIITERLVLTVTTMDTTTHNIIWKVDTLGDGNSSTLWDVAILSDTEAYAVGEIYKKDSTGQFNIDPYNFVKWDGKQWFMQSITYVPLGAVYAFSGHDIWVGSSAPYHWDGSSWRAFNVQGIFNGYINKIWGTSSSDLYIVGTNGSIGHYDGQKWQKIESGTVFHFQDIFGAESKSGNLEIYVVGVQEYPPDRALLSVKSGVVTSISTSPIGPLEQLFSIWFIPERHYYVIGDGVYEKTSISDSTWSNGPFDITRFGLTKIRGSGLNDVFIAGAFGECLHWNGNSWKSYKAQTGLTNGSYSGISVVQHLVIAVGGSESKAIIATGRK